MRLMRVLIRQEKEEFPVATKVELRVSAIRVADFQNFSLSFAGFPV